MLLGSASCHTMAASVPDNVRPANDQAPFLTGPHLWFSGKRDTGSPSHSIISICLLIHLFHNPLWHHKSMVSTKSRRLHGMSSPPEGLLTEERSVEW
jgi:hypothetical protein